MFSRMVPRLGLTLGSYNTGKPLVIDPILSYSATGVGGSSIAVDSQGNAYVIGAATPAFRDDAGGFPEHSRRRTAVSMDRTQFPAPTSWSRN